MKGVTVTKIEPAHEDKRRSLSAMFNNDFTARQIKIIRVKEDSILGNHYHNYRETFYVLEGEANYTVEDVDTRQRARVILRKGDRMTIDPRIAHKALIRAGTIMIEGTEKPYISQDINDQRYLVE